MPTNSEAQVGANIRDMRLNRGLTLEALAEATGLTRSYLSRIENSAKAPPVSTLFKISRALDIRLSFLLGEDSERQRISIVRKGYRQKAEQGNPVLPWTYWDVIEANSRRTLRAFVVEGDPSRTTSRELSAPSIHGATHRLGSQHEAEELFFVLEGTIRFHYDDQDFVLQEGDCICFNATIPHFVDTIHPGGKALFVTAPRDGIRPALPPQLREGPNGDTIGSEEEQKPDSQVG